MNQFNIASTSNVEYKLFIVAIQIYLVLISLIKLSTSKKIYETPKTTRTRRQMYKQNIKEKLNKE